MDKFKDCSFGEKTKIISESWGKLTDDQKIEYNTKAADDKVRYEKELKQLERKGWFKDSNGKDSRDLYKPKKIKNADGEEVIVEPKPPKSKKTLKVKMTREERKEWRIKKREEEQKKLEDREIAKPKRPLSAYVFFSNANRERIIKKFPDIKITEIMRQSGEDWKKLTEEQKKKFDPMIEKDKARFDKEME